MNQQFAQYANAGRYSLEVVYSKQNSNWDWSAKAINPNTGKLPEFQGSATTRDMAKRDAMQSIGLVIDPGWKDMGPDANARD